MPGVKINFTATLTDPCPNARSHQAQGSDRDRRNRHRFRVLQAMAGGASSCANFDGPYVVGKITVTVTWTTTGPPIATTPIVYKNNPATASGSPPTPSICSPPGDGDEVRIVHRSGDEQHHRDRHRPSRSAVRTGTVLELPHPRGLRSRLGDRTAGVPGGEGSPGSLGGPSPCGGHLTSQG